MFEPALTLNGSDVSSASSIVISFLFIPGRSARDGGKLIAAVERLDVGRPERKTAPASGRRFDSCRGTSDPSRASSGEKRLRARSYRRGRARRTTSSRGGRHLAGIWSVVNGFRSLRSSVAMSVLQ